jgi:serine/threonine protein kinase
LVHRDIKPSNIIFVKGAPKFADVGLVTSITAPTPATAWLGTKGYIAPEGPGAPSADLYSLGIVLYEAATGLNQKRFPELPSALPERADRREFLWLNRICLRACDADPLERYRSAAELYENLARLETRLRR